MEGVTILNTFEVVERAPGWTWWALIPIILTIVAIIGVYVADYICEPGVSIMLAFGAIVFMVASAFVILTGKELPPVVLGF